MLASVKVGSMRKSSPGAPWVNVFNVRDGFSLPPTFLTN